MLYAIIFPCLNRKIPNCSNYYSVHMLYDLYWRVKNFVCTVCTINTSCQKTNGRSALRAGGESTRPWWGKSLDGLHVIDATPLLLLHFLLSSFPQPKLGGFQNVDWMLIVEEVCKNFSFIPGGCMTMSKRIFYGFYNISEMMPWWSTWRLHRTWRCMVLITLILRTKEEQTFF